MPASRAAGLDWQQAVAAASALQPLDLFYRQGYRATGINEVIRKSGVAKAIDRDSASTLVLVVLIVAVASLPQVSVISRLEMGCSCPALVYSVDPIVLSKIFDVL